MKISRKAFAFLLVLVVCFSFSYSEEPTALRTRIEHWRTLIRELMQADQLPGVSVAVMLEGQLVWVEGFGYAELEHKVPVIPETRFRIGSISKTLTAAALGHLVEEGKLDLDRPVQVYAPAYPEKRFPLTTRLVAGHLSGIPHYSEEEFLNHTPYESVVHALDKFKDRPLLFQPGERFEYSSFGWNLIAAVLEGAAEEPFLELMERRDFQPLEMCHTIPDQNYPIIPNRARPYGVIGGQVINAPQIDNSDAWASGEFLSTSVDLVLYGQGMLGRKLHSAETIALLWTPMQTTDGAETGYGIGWQVGEIAGRKAIGHSGQHVGATGDFWVVPEASLVIAVLTNANSAGLPELAKKIAGLFLIERPLPAGNELRGTL